MLPPDSSPKRYNKLYLAGKAREKEYEQIVRTPFDFSAGKPALWKAPFRVAFSIGGDEENPELKPAVVMRL